MASLMEQITSDSVIFHKCPYNGSVEAKNLDFKEDGFFSIYPVGVYESSIEVFSQSSQLLGLSLENLINKTNRNG